MKKAILFTTIFMIIKLNAGPLDQSTVSVEADLLEGPLRIIKGDDGNQTKPGGRTLFVYIKNKTDKILRIPTKVFDLKYEEMDEFILVTMEWKYPDLSRERKIIISEANIGIVELRKGETASIADEISQNWPVFRKPLRLKMQIPPAVWERYNLDFFSFIVNIE